MSAAGADRAAVSRLLAAGRGADALALLAGAADRDATRGLQADILKQLGRLDEALALRQADAAARPASMAAQHNLAALLGDMGRFPEAEAAARGAFARGGDAPETWLVMARALLGQGLHDEAENAFAAALARRPGYVEAVKELGQLIWMRTGQLEAARGPVDAALAAAPADPALRIIRSALMEYAGVEPGLNRRLLIQGAGQGDPALEMTAATLIQDQDPGAALEHALRAVERAPASPAPWLILARCRLAVGQAAEAISILTRLAPTLPDEQMLWALLGVAERLGGAVDPRLRLNDRANIGAWTIATPPGWSGLDAYLADLAAALRALHTFKTHPVGQSLRQGTQTHVNLQRAEHPAIQAFFQAIDAPIRQHIAQMGAGDDPLRRRNTGGYRLSGCWSVQLAPHGFHAAHVHREGWLSSACYIDLPAVVGGQGHEGWISFGRPPFKCPRPLDPLMLEQPQPGKLVLFPSYLWHETIPFSGDQTRLTIAFDVVPA